MISQVEDYDGMRIPPDVKLAELHRDANMVNRSLEYRNVKLVPLLYVASYSVGLEDRDLSLLLQN